MVDDALGDHTLKVVGCDGDSSSIGTVLGTPFTDGFNVVGDGRGVLGCPTTLSETGSAASAACASLLSPGVSSGGWWH